MAVGGVVLAAGGSVRMGRNKLLLPFRGSELLCHALWSMAAASVEPACCVLGADSTSILQVLGPRPFPRPIRFLVNPNHATGRASSVRLALESLPQECDAAIFLPGDMPLVTAGDIDALVARFERTHAPLVAAVDGAGERAHPVLFARGLFPLLAALQGDESGQAIIRDHWEAAEKVRVPADHVLDVDTEEDYRRLLARTEGERAGLL